MSKSARPIRSESHSGCGSGFTIDRDVEEHGMINSIILCYNCYNLVKMLVSFLEPGVSWLIAGGLFSLLESSASNIVL